MIGVAIARETGFDGQALLLEADRPTAELIAATAESSTRQRSSRASGACPA